MDVFVEYLRFPDIEKASEYTLLLEKHNIPFELDDASMRFQLIATKSPWESQFILRIKESDIDRAERVFESEIAKEVKDLPSDHYLYTFSDKDILDIIANQNDWTKTEVNLALDIAKERKIELSAQSIKLAKNKSANQITEVKPQLRSTIQSTASWFWAIAIFSILNSIFIRINVNFHLPGLAMTEIFENAYSNIFGEGNRIGFITCLIISTVFFLISRFGKRNKWIFLTGLIIYFLDSLLVIASFRWLQVIFIFIALWSMITGLVNTFKDTDDNVAEKA